MGNDAAPLLDLQGFSLDRTSQGRCLTLMSDIDLCLRPGQWVAVLGANGSGKSSLLKFLAGEDSPLDGGVAYVAQDPDDQILAATVRGEITMVARGGDPAPLLREFDLDGLADLDPRLLSAGQKQRLTLASALMSDPRVLICDEPTSLQDQEQSIWMLDRLDQWRRRTGGGLLTATCDRREASRADWLVILDEGRVLVQGPSSDLLAGAAAADLLVGGDDAAEASTTRPGPDGSRVLALSGVACGFLGPGGGLTGVDLAVAQGERIGLTGPNGCGKSTLLAICAGLRAPDAGRVEIAGRVLYRHRGQDLDHGLAMLAPQFPEYMFCRPTVRAELATGPLAGPIDGESFLQDLGLDPQVMAGNPHDLSSGQRRRLAVGMTARCGRPLLLFDEPTCALDRRGRNQVAAILTDISPTSALVIASHDRTFLQRLGCRLVEMRPGEMGLAASG